MVQEQPLLAEEEQQTEAVVSKPIKPAEEVVTPEESSGPENGTAENGHAENGGASLASTEATAANGEPVEEELWRKRLWFVRFPKPPEVSAVKALEQELETYRAQHKLLTESFTVKRVERDAARDATRAAREAFKASKEAFEAKLAIFQPMRNAAQTTSEGVKKLREGFSELEVRTEAELDERLQQLHFRIEHESIPLNEEKRILQQIKKLEGQRAKVREYEEKVGTLAESRTEVKRLEGEVAEHRAELDALKSEKNIHWGILEKLREQEAELDKDVEEILTDRKRVKDVMDECYARVSEMKSVQKAKNDEFYSNRRFSKTVREMLAAGKLEEARQACAEQMEEAHAKLNADPDYRAEYFALWEQQRKSPVSMVLEDVGAEAPASKRGAKRQEQQPAVDPAKKAVQVIAEALEEAKVRIQEEKEKAAIANAAAASGPAVAEPSLASAAEPEPEAPPKAAAKPLRPRKEVPKHLVEVPVLPPDNFELPEAIKTKKAPSAEELRALEREHQRQVQLDAERRKQRKLQEAEKKRQRALREQQVAAAKAKEAAASTGSAAAAAAAEADAPPEPSGDEAVPASADEAPAVPTVQPTAAGKALAKASKVQQITSKPKPQARRPAGAAKPKGMAKHVKALQSFVKENQLVAMAGAALLFLLLSLALFLALRG